MNFFAKTSLGLCVLVGSANLYAYEPAEGLYGTFFIGPSYAPATNIRFNLPFPESTVLTARATYNVTADVGGAIGYRCYKFRYEGELVFNANTLSKLTFANGLIPVPLQKRNKGQTWLVGGLFNVYYEFYDEDNP